MDAKGLPRGVGGEDAPTFAPRDEGVPRGRGQRVYVHPSSRSRWADEKPAVSGEKSLKLISVNAVSEK